MSHGNVPATSLTTSYRSKLLVVAALLAVGLGSSWAQAATITWQGGSGSSWGVAANWDLLRVPGAGDDVQIPAGSSPATVNINSGTYSIGRLTCGRNLSISGATLAITDTTYTSVISGNLTLQNSAVLDGAASLTVNGTLTWNSSAVMQGGGTTTIGPNGALAVIGYVSLANRTLVNYSASASSSITGSVLLDGGSTFTNAAGAQFTVGSSLSGSSQLAKGGGANAFINEGTLIKESTQTLTISAPCTNHGVISISAGTVDINGTFNNLSGTTLTDGTYDLTGVLKLKDADIAHLAGTAKITLRGTNAAILNRATSADALANLATVASECFLSLRNGRELTTTTPLSNAGTIAIGDASAVGGGAGKLTVGGGYTQTAGTMLLDGGTLEAPGGIDIQAGTLGGTGTLSGEVVNAGTVAPGLSPGILAIAGGYTQLAGGTLAVELAGLTAGTGFDQLQVTGTAALAGTLSVSLLNGFQPAPSDTFEIMTFASVSGDFTSVVGDYVSTSFSATNCLVSVGSPALGQPLHVKATPRSLCMPGVPTVLTATPGAGGDTVDWFTDGCGQTLVPGGAAPSVTPTETTTYYARTRNSASGAVSALCAAFTVTVGQPKLGDFDGDCDVDADDLDAFNACLSGPGNQYPQGDACLKGDFDGDLDVDQDDFGSFQQAYTGILTAPVDYDGDGDVDRDDWEVFVNCFSGPAVRHANTADCFKSDLDHDNDVDLNDFGAFQRCFRGTDELADLDCAD